jgi:hypothetical protein
MLCFFHQLAHNNASAHVGFVPRTGVNNFPFRQQLTNLTHTSMPDYDCNFNLTWNEITDQRARQIEKRMWEENKKIVVLWSGGIDSTCIMSAILKNFDPISRSQVVVACTLDSVVENPVFYTKHILPNFKTIDTNHFIDKILPASTDILMVEGFGADTLTMSMTPSLDVHMAIKNSNLLTQDWKKNPDELIAYLAQVTKNKNFATWYYERTQENIESTGLPIETYFDFLWWMGFNCDYQSWAVHNWFFSCQHLKLNWSELNNKTIGWYRTDHYQLWALKNIGPNIKHGSTLGSFKKHPKQYIYNYDGNEYYWRYKTKVNSAGRKYNMSAQKAFAITDTFEILYLESDLEKIIELLPTHINF